MATRMSLVEAMDLWADVAFKLGYEMAAAMHGMTESREQEFLLDLARDAGVLADRIRFAKILFLESRESGSIVGQ